MEKKKIKSICHAKCPKFIWNGLDGRIRFILRSNKIDVTTSSDKLQNRTKDETSGIIFRRTWILF